MKRRLLALLLSLTLIATIFTGCGNSGSGSNSSSKSEEQKVLDSITLETAEVNGVCGEDAYWYYQDNVLVIKGTGKVTSSPWQEAEEFSFRDEVSWLIVDEGITSLPDGAFKVGETISKIKLPSTLKRINRECFQHCNFEKITIPENVTYIGDWVLGENYKLKTVEFLGENLDDIEITDKAFGNTNIKKIIAVKESELLKEIFTKAEFEYTGE